MATPLRRNFDVVPYWIYRPSCFRSDVLEIVLLVREMKTAQKELTLIKTLDRREHNFNYHDAQRMVVVSKGVREPC